MSFGLVNDWGFRFGNVAVAASAPGTSVTPGASNVQGSWAQLAAGSDIAAEVLWIEIAVTAGSTSGSAKPQLLDIGIDPAGGTSYTAILQDICAGNSCLYANGIGLEFGFPLRIPAGASVAARMRGGNATAGTVRVGAAFYGRPSRPHLVPVAQIAETIGGDTANSGGVVVVAGTAPTEGTWTSLGTTTRTAWWWQLGIQFDNAAHPGAGYLIDLAYGDASNKTLIIERAPFAGNSAEAGVKPFRPGFRPVPAGATLYARAMSSIAAPDLEITATGCA